MWSLAGSNPYETAKSSVLAKMASGRYRSDWLTRYWSKNRSGCCRAPTCQATPGTLEHLLVGCPALNNTRERLYSMWLQRSVMFPSLHANIRTILNSPDTTIVQFVLEPLAFPEILADYLSNGIHFAHLLSYLTRTYAFNMHRDYQRIVNDPPHHQVACEQLNNASYFSVSGDDVDHHPSVLSIAVAECVGPLRRIGTLSCPKCIPLPCQPLLLAPIALLLLALIVML